MAGGFFYASVAEPVYAQDLNSCGYDPCGFKSRQMYFRRMLERNTYRAKNAGPKGCGFKSRCADAGMTATGRPLTLKRSGLRVRSPLPVYPGMLERKTKPAQNRLHTQCVGVRISLPGLKTNTSKGAIKMPVIDIKATGANIKKMIRQKGMTAKDIQKACGFTTCNTIYKWFNGVCMPTIDNMVIIASICGTTIDSIIVISK